jgi:hyperosmotically inducible protein
MNARMKLGAPLVLASVAALAATGFAMRTQDVSQSQIPAESAAMPVAADASIAPAGEGMPATTIRSTPTVERYSEPSVTVTAPRLSNDELMRNAVMDRLASDTRLSGRIGVEAYQHTVSLTGRVGSRIQVERAGTIARSVDGVLDVNNELRARMGES